MTHVIEIEGDLIRRIDRRVVQEANLKDISQFMETRVPVTLPTLPRHPVRAVHYDASNAEQTTLHLLAEVPPAVRTIEYYSGDQERPTLSMPWTVWNFVVRTRSSNPRGQDWTLDDTRIYWAQEQITDLDQYVIPALMPNVYSDASICFGDTGVTPYQPLADRIDEIINDFYLSAFNDDLGRLWPWGDSSCATWVEETKDDRSCWQNFPEWELSNTNTIHLQLKDIFNWTIDRNAPRTLGNDIPPLTFLPTFGRTREWLDGLSNDQRLRLRTEIDAMVTEAPDLFRVATDG